MVSKMDGHEVIEQIGRGTFGAAFLVLHKLRTKDQSIVVVEMLWGCTNGNGEIRTRDRWINKALIPY
ncbi:hypothetical protein SADUNF_Sadunf17G0055000 [Salix dunnii]|uniref:Protein kinase domain-containing protein n=1 Tax=Salix dunnii TaxID=1413687 RepID=A0A835J5K5_9ROSI|nr:hypothetical protein SADUNF_Sadunf17G0055000 [Salix dunnii]